MGSATKRRFGVRVLFSRVQPFVAAGQRLAGGDQTSGDATPLLRGIVRHPFGRQRVSEIAIGIHEYRTTSPGSARKELMPPDPIRRDALYRRGTRARNHGERRNGDTRLANVATRHI